MGTFWLWRISGATRAGSDIPPSSSRMLGMLRSLFCSARSAVIGDILTGRWTRMPSAPSWLGRPGPNSYYSPRPDNDDGSAAEAFPPLPFPTALDADAPRNRRIAATDVGDPRFVDTWQTFVQCAELPTDIFSALVMDAAGDVRCRSFVRPP